MDQTTPPPAVKRLLRSRTDRVIAGVCAGIGEYFGIDPTIIRVIFVAMVFGGGFGIGVYIILWLVVPEAGAEQQPIEDRMKSAGQDMANRAQTVAQSFRGDDGTNSRVIPGVILIAIGAIALTNIYVPWRIFRWETVWPIVLVLVGLVIIFRRK